MPEVNPEILTWARETAGLTREDAVKKLSIRAAYGIEPEERLMALETGAIEPTRPMLVKMAKQYRRPLLDILPLEAADEKGIAALISVRCLPSDQPRTKQYLTHLYEM